MKAVSTKISEFMSKQVEAINIIYVNGFNFFIVLPRHKQQ